MPVNGVRPDEVARDIAWLTKRQLERRAEIEARLIGGRRFERMGAVERGERARFARADLYIRFHARPGGDPAGVAARSPDGAGRHGGVDGPTMEVRHRSRLAAVAVAKELRDAARGRIPTRGARGESETWEGRELGAAIESIHAGVPTLTVELGAFGDPVDASFYRSRERRDTVARAVATGVVRYREFLKRKRGAELRDELIEYYPVY